MSVLMLLGDTLITTDVHRNIFRHGGGGNMFYYYWLTVPPYYENHGTTQQTYVAGWSSITVYTAACYGYACAAIRFAEWGGDRFCLCMVTSATPSRGYAGRMNLNANSYVDFRLCASASSSPYMAEAAGSATHWVGNWWNFYRKGEKLGTTCSYTNYCRGVNTGSFWYD